jgi:hypothetical protein
MGYGASTTRIDATNGTSTFWGMVLNGKDCSAGVLKTDSSGAVICGTSSGGASADGVYGKIQASNGAGLLVSSPLFTLSTSTIGSLSLFVGIGTTTPLHTLDVKGRINAIPMIECVRPLFSSANVVADRLQTTTTGGVCGDQMQLDVITTNGGILADADNSASGTPSLMRMDASIAVPSVNNLVAIKSFILGSATSTLGQGISAQQIVRLPTVAVSTTSARYFFGFSNVSAGSVATDVAYSQPSDGCMVMASSSANFKLVCYKASVASMADTGIATSTAITNGVKFLLVLDGSGANVYVNGGNTSRATISSANLPVKHLRYVAGVTIGGTAMTIGQARMDIGRIKVWGEDMP